MNIDIAPDAGVLDGVRECDVAVVGSGIAGISTAYELCKRSKSVFVIDRGRICGGMTSRTSAHLAPLCDDLVSEMAKIRGKEATTLFCDSQAAASLAAIPGAQASMSRWAIPDRALRTALPARC